MQEPKHPHLEPYRAELDANPEKAEAAIVRENKDGTLHLRGFRAIDPKGHLVTLPPSTGELEPGWRWGTLADEHEKAQLERDRQAAEQAPDEIKGE